MAKQSMRKKNILITGASSGIGASTAVKLCSEGHNVVGVARRVEKLQNIAKKCEHFSGEFVGLECDVRDSEQVTSVVNTTIDQFGGIDVLIPNAGLGHFNRLDESPLEEWKSMVDINIMGVLNTIHASLPHLIESKGHVINIGSVAARNVFELSGVYCATKHAVLALSESLRMEFTNQLAVTTINPGHVNTEFIEATNNLEIREKSRVGFESGMTSDFIAQAIYDTIAAEGKAIYSEVTLRPDRR
jgi:NADP-dependent 3-hydroxy acid dehydrogenase YdfG